MSLQYFVGEVRATVSITLRELSLDVSWQGVGHVRDYFPPII